VIFIKTDLRLSDPAVPCVVLSCTFSYPSVCVCVCVCVCFESRTVFALDLRAWIAWIHRACQLVTPVIVTELRRSCFMIRCTSWSCLFFYDSFLSAFADESSYLERLATPWSGLPFTLFSQYIRWWIDRSWTISASGSCLFFTLFPQYILWRSQWILDA